MEYSILEKLIEKPISGEWGSGDGDISVIRSANFTNQGRINFDKIVTRNIPDNKVETKKLQEEDIIIEKSGGSPTQPVGRVVFFDQKGTYLCNNFTSILRPLKQHVFPKYLHYILFCNHRFGFVEKYQNKTTGIINLQLPKYLKNTEIPLPPLADQQKIAAILDAADNLRQKDQQLIDKYNALGKSLFLDMFGDPASNPMGWNKKIIDDFSEVQGGLQVSVKRDKLPITIKYLRVANVYRNQLNLTEIKTINATEAEINRVLLKKNDLLVVEGHGNKNEIGRVGLWDDSIKPIVHQNHLIRVRVNEDVINQVYLCHYLNSEGGRLSMIGSSNTTSGLNTISTRIVKNTPCFIPPISLQNQFAERIQSIETQKQLALASLQKSETLLALPDFVG